MIIPNRDEGAIRAAMTVHRRSGPRDLEAYAPRPFGHRYFHAHKRLLSRTSPALVALYTLALRTSVESAAIMAPVNEMYAGEDHSWQDVYASYGCSLEFDVSDDDG